jgi:hypothetical protein
MCFWLLIVNHLELNQQLAVVSHADSVRQLHRGVPVGFTVVAA